MVEAQNKENYDYFTAEWDQKFNVYQRDAIN